MEALAGLRRGDKLVMGLARHHLAAHPKAMGILYVDGHVRAYHGGADLPRAHLARARIAMAATSDTWIADAQGDAVLVWSSVPGAALTGELKDVAVAVRELLGPDARPTICFDRGGWSPATFAALVAGGFDIATYRKGPLSPEPHDAFTAHQVKDSFGHPATYLLADRQVQIPYDKGREVFACRQVTRLDEDSGHQTQILTTRVDLAAPAVAQVMFARWREENLFRFMRPRAEDEAHSLLSEAFSASADLEIIGEELHVRIEALSSPRRSRAIAALCLELTATETVYPGTGLRLVYSVKTA